MLLLFFNVFPRSSTISVKIPYPVIVWKEMSVEAPFGPKSSSSPPQSPAGPVPAIEEEVRESSSFEEGAFHTLTTIDSNPLDVYRVLADVENYKAWGGTGIKETKMVECKEEDAIADINCGAFGFSFHLQCNGKFQQAHNSTVPHKVSFKLLREVPFIKSFEARYYISPSTGSSSSSSSIMTIHKNERDNVNHEINTPPNAHTELKFSSIVRFSGMIPKFVQLSMKKLVNEIAVGELKKYCEDGRMQEDFLIRPIPKLMTLTTLPQGKNRPSRINLPFPLPMLGFKKVTLSELAKCLRCIFVNNERNKFYIPGLPLWLNLCRERVYPIGDGESGNEDTGRGIWNETMSHMPHFDLPAPTYPYLPPVNVNPVTTLAVFLVQTLFTLSLNPITILDKIKNPRKAYSNLLGTLNDFRAMIQDHHQSHHYQHHHHPRFELHLYNASSHTSDKCRDRDHKS